MCIRDRSCGSRLTSYAVSSAHSRRPSSRGISDYWLSRCEVLQTLTDSVHLSSSNIAVSVYTTFRLPTPFVQASKRYFSIKIEVYIGWSDVIDICGHNTISTLWGNTTYCVKLGGEDLSRCSNKIQSVGLRKCLYYQYLTKWCHSNKHSAEFAPYHGPKNSWYRYDVNKLRHCHRAHRNYRAINSE